MKRTFILLIAALFLLNGYAQRRETPDRKFIYMTSVGYATGLGEIHLMNDDGEELKTVQNRNFNISVNQLLGYQFNPYFQMGIGAGFDFWRHTAFIPIYLNFTVNFTDTKIEPLFYLNAGYAFKWYVSSVPEKMDRVVHGTKTGPMGEAGIGMRINLYESLSTPTSDTPSLIPTNRISQPTPPTLSKTRSITSPASAWAYNSKKG